MNFLLIKNKLNFLILILNKLNVYIFLCIIIIHIEVFLTNYPNNISKS